MTPYGVVYGQNHLLMEFYIPGASKVHALYRMLHTIEAIIYILKDNLVMEQNWMKQQVDQHIFERYYNEGDQVFLLL